MITNINVNPYTSIHTTIHTCIRSYNNKSSKTAVPPIYPCLSTPDPRALYFLCKLFNGKLLNISARRLGISYGFSPS